MSLQSQMLLLAAAAMISIPAFAQYPQGPPGGGTPTQNPAGSQPGTPGGGMGGNPGAVPGGGMGVPMGSPDIMVSDKDFVKKTAENAATDIELGKLAQEKGSSDAVKEFGKRIVEDHEKTHRQLQQAAARVNVEVPSELPKKAKKAQDKLSKLSGPEFDRTYAKMMLSQQKDDLEAFNREAQDGRIPEVKQFAAQNLPKIQQRQQMAQQLEASVKTNVKK
jgi:putative membrane protein